MQCHLNALKIYQVHLTVILQHNYIELLAIYIATSSITIAIYNVTGSECLSPVRKIYVAT